MLIEYRVLRVEFRNYKLLGLFTGILEGLLGHLDTISGGRKWEGMRIVQECKLTGRRGCQENTQMVVSSWQRTVGRRGEAHGCLWHTASIWHRWHRKNMHPYHYLIPLPSSQTTSPTRPPSRFGLSHHPASKETIVLYVPVQQRPLWMLVAHPRTEWSEASEA